MTQRTPKPTIAAAVTALLAALSLLAALAFAPTAGAAVKPSPGTYEAQPSPPSGIFQPGTFTVASDGTKRRIVPTEGYAGIYYPDAGECDRFELPLAVESIPISRKGRFSWREKTPAKRGSVLVVWKGTWVKAKRVTGTLKISYRKCDSKIAWSGRRVVVR